MPAVKHNALTAARVRTLKEPGSFSDGNGLTLRIDDLGNKAWFLRVTVNGKRRNIGVGGYPTVGLAEAREVAVSNLAAIRHLQPSAKG